VPEQGAFFYCKLSTNSIGFDKKWRLSEIPAIQQIVLAGGNYARFFVSELKLQIRLLGQKAARYKTPIHNQFFKVRTSNRTFFMSF
jgi:hypothetical protein